MVTASQPPLATEPAFDIPLTEGELRIIGEICAIQGQIEYLLLLTAQKALGVGRETASAILGSTAVRTNADIWIKIMREKCTDQAALMMAEEVFTGIAVLAQGRNDFIHAIFMWQGPHGDLAITVTDGGSSYASSRGAVAVRTKSQTIRPAGELTSVREQAAKLSRQLATIHTALTGIPMGRPWP